MERTLRPVFRSEPELYRMNARVNDSIPTAESDPGPVNRITNETANALEQALFSRQVRFSQVAMVAAVTEINSLSDHQPHQQPQPIFQPQRIHHREVP